MSMFNRFAKDISESLFNSVYSEMFKIAESEQKAIRAQYKGKKYFIGEAQEKFTAFCKNSLSLGEALNFIEIRKLYA